MRANAHLFGVTAELLAAMPADGFCSRGGFQSRSTPHVHSLPLELHIRETAPMGEAPSPLFHHAHNSSMHRRKKRNELESHAQRVLSIVMTSLEIGSDGN